MNRSFSRDVLRVSTFEVAVKLLLLVDVAGFMVLIDEGVIDKMATHFFSLSVRAGQAGPSLSRYVSFLVAFF